MAAQELVQSSGRGMRAEDDHCETLIVDGNFGWWWKANKKWTPKWWQGAVRWAELSSLPPPPPKLQPR
jgi:Rad3-related DNA helicase